MYVKWIKCEVEEHSKAAFSNAQAKWEKLKKLDGFLGQIGGWDQQNPNEAGILAFWKDQHAYDSFMKYSHDEIYEKSGQIGTYKSISINFYERIFTINSKDITHFLKEGDLLRVADCLVYTNKIQEFMDAQKEVWNKGMAESPGMLAGVFCKSLKQSERYLVASLWQNNNIHQAYVRDKLPSLLRDSEVRDQAQNITGNLIELNPSWVVLK